jgi:hypothetical protein
MMTGTNLNRANTDAHTAGNHGELSEFLKYPKKKNPSSVYSCNNLPEQHMM